MPDSLPAVRPAHEHPAHEHPAHERPAHERPSAATSSDTPDEFDALLEPAARAVIPAPTLPSTANTTPATSGATEAHVSIHSGGPSLAEFGAHWDLYRDPVSCAVLAGAGLAALGVFVVLRRAVFVTAALSQTAGLGVAAAIYLEIHHAVHLPPVALAIALSLAATLLLARRPRVKMARETLVGVVFITASAFAVLVGDRIAQEAHDVSSILFGSAVLVRSLDLWMVGAVTLVAGCFAFVFRRLLTFAGFDPEGARVQGLPVSALEGCLWVLLALQVSVSTRALGSLPVFSFVVLPAASALLLAESVGSALALAVVLGAASGGLGYLLAFLAELPVGASQAALASFAVIVCYALARIRRLA